MSPGCGIMYLGFFCDLVAEVAAQVLRGAQVNLAAAKQDREFSLHIRQFKETRRFAWRKLHEYINITLWVEVIS